MKGITLAALARVDTVARIAVMACMAAMIAIVSAQVVMRYVFNNSIDWAEEISRLAFVATVFLAIPLGLRDGAHVGIDILVKRLPAVPRDWLARLMSLTAAAMLAVVFFSSIHVASTTWSERLGSLAFTSSVFFFPIIVSAAHTSLHLITLAIWPDAHAALTPPEHDPLTEQPS